MGRITGRGNLLTSLTQAVNFIDIENWVVFSGIVEKAREKARADGCCGLHKSG